MALILTLLSGIGFLLGIIISSIFKDNKKIEVSSIALAFVILFNLIFLDIIPEVSFTKMGIVSAILGFLLLKGLDLLVPHHHHEHHDKNDNEKEHDSHINHISSITVYALSLHNLIECVALYNVAINDLKSGILMCLAINLHNLPLGTQIALKWDAKRIVYVIILILSGFMGGIASLLFGSIPENMENIILLFTLGMLLYLFIFEIAKEMLHNLKNKYTYYGIIVGIVLTVISYFI